MVMEKMSILSEYIGKYSVCIRSQIVCSHDIAQCLLMLQNNIIYDQILLARSIPGKFLKASTLLNTTAAHLI